MAVTTGPSVIILAADADTAAANLQGILWAGTGIIADPLVFTLNGTTITLYAPAANYNIFIPFKGQAHVRLATH